MGFLFQNQSCREFRRGRRATAQARSLSEQCSGTGQGCLTRKAREADGRPRPVEGEAGSARTQHPSRARSKVPREISVITEHPRPVSGVFRSTQVQSLCDYWTNSVRFSETVISLFVTFVIYVPYYDEPETL